MKTRTAWSKKANLAMVMKNLSTKEIAEKCGFTPQYTASILSGRASFKPAIEQISALLEITDTDSLD